MSPRLINLLFYTASATLLLVGVTALVVPPAVSLDEIPTAASPAASVTPSRLPVAGLDLPSAELIDRLAKIDFRRPLEGPEFPSVAAASDEPLPPLPGNLKLTGLILEPGRSFGVFSHGLGSVDLVGPGSSVIGVQVAEIGPNFAVLLYGRRTYKLDIAKPEPSNSDAAVFEFRIAPELTLGHPTPMSTYNPEIPTFFSAPDPR